MATRHPGVYQRHTACSCVEQTHRASCPQTGACKCPREHDARCSHRERSDGKARCGCPWAFGAQATRAGRRVQATGSGFSSMTAAAKARSEALETLKRAPSAAKRGDDLSTYLENWMRRKAEGSNALRPTTLRDYRSYVDLIGEAIGGERLRDVNADTLDDLERYLIKHRPGAAVAHARCFAVVQSALRDAYRRGLIVDDPTRRRDAVRAPKRRRAMMQPEQFAHLHRWAAAKGERLAPLIWIAATTGLRRGELAGLRWIDVELEAGRLTVEQQAIQFGSEILVGKPKTAAGEGRVVMLDSLTVAALRAVQAQQAMDAAEWGDAYANDALLVFTHEDGSQLKPEVLTKGLPRLIERYNEELRIRKLPADSPELEKLMRSRGMGARRLNLIRADETLVGQPLPVVTFHSLRHLSASIMLAAGRGLASTQRRLGHSSITVTSDLYGHLVEHAGKADAEAAVALISVGSERDT